MVRAVVFEPGKKIERLAEVTRAPTALQMQVGTMLVAQAQEAFREQRSSEGRWRERAPINVFGIIADFSLAGRSSPPARRFETRPALVDTGALRRSIAWQGRGTNVVEVGSNLPYASLHQFGGVSESEKITESVQEKLHKWLRKQSKELRDALGWLLNKKYTGTKLRMQVEARPFVEISPQTIKDVKQTIGITIAEI